MRKLTQITTCIAVVALLAVPAFSDTLVLKSGEKVTGYFEGGSARVIKFRTTDGVVKDFDLFSVQQIQFGDEKSAAVSSAPSTPRAVTPPAPAPPAAVPSNSA